MQTYDEWVSRGLIYMTDKPTADYEAIEEKVCEVNQHVNLQALGVDRWNSTYIIQRMMDRGIPCVQYGQGYGAMNAPTKLLLKFCLDGNLRHPDHGVLNWNADNVVVETNPAGDIKPNKKRSLEKIDGIVAGVMGIGLWNAAEGGESVYDDRGLTILD